MVFGDGDVFGSMVKQWAFGQSVTEADWLIGADVFTPAIDADALRSLSAPGTAFDNTVFGRDPQPAHMNDFVELPDTEEGDFGGVHINSGIPNKAFHLVATAIGGSCREAAGHIWYEALRVSTPLTQCAEFAGTTHAKAGELFGPASNQQQAVADAWDAVGVPVPTPPPGADADAPSIAGPAQQLESLTTRMHALAADVQALASRL